MFGPRLEHTPEAKRWLFLNFLFMLIAFASSHQYVKNCLDPNLKFTLRDQFFDTAIVLLCLFFTVFYFFTSRVQLRVLDFFVLVTFAALLLVIYRTSGIKPIFPLSMTIAAGCFGMFFYRTKQAGIKLK